MAGNKSNVSSMALHGALSERGYQEVMLELLVLVAAETNLTTTKHILASHGVTVVTRDKEESNG